MDNFDLRKYVANRTLTTTSKRRVPVQEAKKKKSSYMAELAEIDKQSHLVAMEAKINKLAEMIEAKNTRLNLVSEDENLSELIDKKRVKEMQREIKEIEKAKLKLEKLFEKMNGGAKKEIVDEDEVGDDAYADIRKGDPMYKGNQEKEKDVDEALGSINDPNTPTAHGNVAEAGYNSKYEEDDNDSVNEDFDDVVDDIMDQGKSREDAEKIAGAINRDYVGNYR